MNQIKNILRSCHRGDKLNIICTDVHERYQSTLAKTGHNFYSVQIPGLKSWERHFADIPNNYHILNPNKPPLEQIPKWVDFDLLLSGHKFGCFQTLKPLADYLGLPLISCEHTTASHLPRQQVFAARQMIADVNIFISEYSMKEWGWNFSDGALVIKHGVDTDLFQPDEKSKKNYPILSIVNDFVNRGNLLGFDIWKRVVNGIPYKLVGRNPGLSEEAKTIQELIQYYQQSLIYLNTSIFSPIPMALLEALSCGLPVITLNNCAIPEYVKHGYNGFLCNSSEELREYCVLLLKDSRTREIMSANARKSALENFPLNKFIDNWNSVFKLE